MIQDNEVLALCMTLGVIILITINFRNFQKIPYFSLLFSGLCLLAAAWSLSILEGFLWPSAVNLTEHIFYLLSAVCLGIWLIKSPLSYDGDEK